MPDAPWAANMSSEGVRPAEALSTNSASLVFFFPSLCLGWAADMSSEGVRPGEALSTDSTILGLAVLVSWLVNF